MKRLEGEISADGSSIWAVGRWWQIRPRQMVKADIYPPYYPPRRFFGSETPVQYLRNGAWLRLDEELKRKLKLHEPISSYNGLSIEQWRERALKAESEARLAQSLNSCYIRQSERNRKRVVDLQEERKVNEDFIKLLSDRLGKRLAQIDTIRRACDVTDGGASLDP
jgi:hypothetical protein